MWLHHPEFHDVVRGAWEQESILPSAIKLFTSRATHWNKTVFGNLFARKRRLLARINGTQKALSNGLNQFLVQLEQDLIKEYADIRLQEEEYWAFKKGKGGFMAIKVDLAKAYDRIEWSFIHKVLKAFHFPQRLIELIMSCVTTTSISILAMEVS